MSRYRKSPKQPSNAAEATPQLEKTCKNSRRQGHRLSGMNDKGDTANNPKLADVRALGESLK